MNILNSAGNKLPLIIGIIAGIVVFLVLLFLLFHFVISRLSVKKQVKEFENKFAYLDGLLTGQDAQHIHRLESISRTNLLYTDKYTEYSTRFKEIHEGEDKYVESCIKQLRARINDKQFKNIKPVLEDTRKTLGDFENSVNALDSELYAIIKPEQESRSNILSLKERFRDVKQMYYNNISSLELCESKFMEAFEKMEDEFKAYDELVEGAEYDEAGSMMANIDAIIRALGNALFELPNLCVLANTVIPNQIKEIISEYQIVEKTGVPVFNIKFRQHVDDWSNSLAFIRKELSNLKHTGLMEKLDAIRSDIEAVRRKINSESNDKVEFENDSKELYAKVIELEKNYVKISGIIPVLKERYIVTKEKENEIESLKQSINDLTSSRRNLDNYVHSETKQPYSILKEKLDDLRKDYEQSDNGVKQFLKYIQTLKSDCEEASEMIVIYNHHTKEVESSLRTMDIQTLKDTYQPQIDLVYEELNDLYDLLSAKPTNVDDVNSKLEELKRIANELFDELDGKIRTEQLAESAILYANRDRLQQSDVNQQLCVLEKAFFEGDFENVYHQATAIYRSKHVEENNGK